MMIYINIVIFILDSKHVYIKFFHKTKDMLHWSQFYLGPQVKHPYHQIYTICLHGNHMLYNALHSNYHGDSLLHTADI